MLSITPFSAIASCDSPIWKYSGVDPIDGHYLNYSTDLMSLNTTSGEIRVAQTKQLGTYNIKVIGTLPDLSTTSILFTINIVRRILSKLYLKVELISNNPSTYTVPFI